MHHPNPLRLLLADDSTTFLASLRAYVESIEGIQVVAMACNGEQAVALCEFHTPDVVIMDLAMPGIGGLEATRILKTLPQAPLVAMLTLHQGEVYRDAANEAGADFFLSKVHFHDEFPALLARLGRA